MVKNVGKTDRIIRLVVGLVLLSLVFVGPQTWWGLLGLVLIVTAGISTCPVYSLLGTSTCESGGAAPAEPPNETDNGQNSAEQPPPYKPPEV